MTQSKPLVSAYIANFRLVDVGLFAGAQPQIPAGIAELQDSYQVKTIIDLRGEDELETQEGLACTERGITHYSIPLPSTEMLEGCVPRDKVMHVLALIEDPANWPLFWHCRRGQDRSSMIEALWMIDQGGTIEEAIATMKRFHNSVINFGMRAFVEDYAEEKAKT